MEVYAPRPQDIKKRSIIKGLFGRLDLEFFTVLNTTSVGIGKFGCIEQEAGVWTIHDVQHLIFL